MAEPKKGSPAWMAQRCIDVMRGRSEEHTSELQSHA